MMKINVIIDDGKLIFFSLYLIFPHLHRGSQIMTFLGRGARRRRLRLGEKGAVGTRVSTLG
jgi:hypothetical protein